MNEGYKPTPEEVVKAENMMSNDEYWNSEERASLFKDIEGLANESNLKFDGPETIKGMVRGHGVVISKAKRYGWNTYIGTVDGIDMPPKNVKKLWETYSKVIRLNTYKEGGDESLK